ncbi:MAG: glutamate 5-kinase [Robiginitomaculum sp.]|nr:MAG: glutamate 5-kinase [Robiginitomaculum sp.]
MAALKPYNRIAVKIGSSLLVDETTGLINQVWLGSLAQDIASLTTSGKQILIISSGAIALGRGRLGLSKANLSLAEKQACAAAGQVVLTQTYEAVLDPLGLKTAQALLTLYDTEDRRRWINARATLATLLKLGAIPIINENDTVATDEIRYGDNDRLAARVAQMCGADLLVLLSDVDGLYDNDPNIDANAQHIPKIDEITPNITAMGGDPNKKRGTGSGGMATKLQAAKIATDAGCTVVITKGDKQNPLSVLASGTENASWFLAKTNPVIARKQWIAGTLKPKGSLIIDAGATRALAKGSSLLAAGLVRVEGHFERGDAVMIVDEKGTEIGRGLTGYNANNSAAIKGLKSGDIEARLGYDGGATLIHRDNMVLNT